MKKRNLKYDKRNDATWCMQFIYPVLGLLFILMNLDDLKRIVSDGNMAMLGLMFILVGFMNHILWKQADTFRKTLATLTKAFEEQKAPNKPLQNTSQ